MRSHKLSQHGPLRTDRTDTIPPFSPFIPYAVPSHAVSYHSERYYRKRREIARLYTPLDVSSDDSFDEDELAELPVYRQNIGSSFGRSPSEMFPSTTPGGGGGGGTNGNGNSGGAPRSSSWPPPKYKKSLRRLGDVWDSGEELFAVGEEDESEEEDRDTKPSGHSVTSESPATRR